MLTLILKSFDYKGIKAIEFFFDYDQQLIQTLRGKFPQLTWSKTYRCWYIQENNQSIQSIQKLLADMNISSKIERIVSKQIRKNTEKKISQTSSNWETEILQFEKWLHSRRYSSSTIRTYLDAIRVFARFYSHKTAPTITNKDVIHFNTEYILAKKYSSSYQNQVVNALKLFYKTIMNKTISEDKLHRPRKENKLPNVLSKSEVKLILDSLSNVKHKAMLSLIYSCGLRRNELIQLKLTDVDSKRNIIIIRQSKGNKDRIVGGIAACDPRHGNATLTLGEPQQTGL